MINSCFYLPLETLVRSDVYDYCTVSEIILSH